MHLKKKDEEIKKLKENLEEMNKMFDKFELEIKKLNEMIAKVEQEIAEQTELNKKTEEKINIKQKTVSLINDAPLNIKKLQVNNCFERLRNITGAPLIMTKSYDKMT